jgi:hypothetical protein
MVQPRHQRLQGAVDPAAARGRLLARGREAEQPERGEGVDLQRLVSPPAQGRRDPPAAPGQDLDQRRGQRRDAQARQLPLELAAARARVVPAGTIVVQATPAPRARQRGVDRHRPPSARPPGQRQDLLVVAGRGQHLQAPAAQDRHARLAVRHPGQVDPHAHPRRPRPSPPSSGQPRLPSLDAAGAPLPDKVCREASEDQARSVRHHGEIRPIRARRPCPGPPPSATAHPNASPRPGPSPEPPGPRASRPAARADKLP